jgi:protein ImuA
MSPAFSTRIFKDLQADILRLQGFRSAKSGSLDIGLGLIREALPGGTFPLGVHEFLPAPEDVASASGFIAALLSSIMGLHGAALWIGSSRTLFPPGLTSFGLEPDRIIFIDLEKEKDILWATEEALKCSALSAVVAEVRDLDFTASRRLQLAVEQSEVPGFILRTHSGKLCTNACIARWKITSLPGEAIDDIPGVGAPAWKVELLRIRNGKCGTWNITWRAGRFVPVDEHEPLMMIGEQKRKAG